MKHTTLAIFAATVAMFATSGIVAFATAAPQAPQAAVAETELVDHLDDLIAGQLAQIKQDLKITGRL